VIGRAKVLLGLAAALVPLGAHAYPLDGYEEAGIRRLDGYRAAQERPGPHLPPGALLSVADIRLHLADVNPDWDPGDVERDPVLQAAVTSIFEGRDPSYAFAVVDITDPDDIVWAGLRDGMKQFPGSVGKIACLAGVFDALARAFPDLEDRQRVLRETVVEATEWAMEDEFHKVPKYDPETRTNRFAPVVRGDRFTLAEWIDHMMSASANSAGATVWKEAMLLRRFGAAYPPDREAEDAFFRGTPKLQLQQLSQEVLDEPLAAAGIDLEAMQQGTMWTKPGQARIPGLPSFATPRELVRILLRIEQGRMVDRWSSLQMKKYLYMTRKRYRYAYAPELAKAAVYFKSGSFYRCAPEEGFRCGKYSGNVENLMNSISIVETPAGNDGGQKRYIVALFSNVLRENSAWDHARLAAAIDEAIRTRLATSARMEGDTKEVEAAGGGD
jgi:Beta-lactamase enzyme family